MAVEGIDEKMVERVILAQEANQTVQQEVPNLNKF